MLTDADTVIPYPLGCETWLSFNGRRVGSVVAWSTADNSQSSKALPVHQQLGAKGRQAMILGSATLPIKLLSLIRDFELRLIIPLICTDA